MKLSNGLHIIRNFHWRKRPYPLLEGVVLLHVTEGTSLYRVISFGSLAHLLNRGCYKTTEKLMDNEAFIFSSGETTFDVIC